MENRADTPPGCVYRWLLSLEPAFIGVTGNAGPLSARSRRSIVCVAGYTAVDPDLAATVTPRQFDCHCLPFLRVL